jgi:hypothetical protein
VKGGEESVYDRLKNKGYQISQETDKKKTKKDKDKRV